MGSNLEKAIRLKVSQRHQNDGLLFFRGAGEAPRRTRLAAETWKTRKEIQRKAIISSQRLPTCKVESGWGRITNAGVAAGERQLAGLVAGRAVARLAAE
jgi:hypothetical protein